MINEILKQLTFMCQGMRVRVRVGTSRKEGAVRVLLKEKSGSGASAVAYFPPSISVVIFMHKKKTLGGVFLSNDELCVTFDPQ